MSAQHYEKSVAAEEFQLWKLKVEPGHTASITLQRSTTCSFSVWGVSHLHSRLARHSVEEKRNRHLKDLGYVLQAARANAVGPLLIFLNLLERQSKRIRKVGLAHLSIRRRMRTRLPTC